MKKILYSVALAACCMGTMTSCSDFLDASNKSNVTAKQSFATKEGLNNLVNDAYQHLQNVYAAPLFTSCFSAGTDMYADARNKMNEALNTYETLTPENTDIKNLYTYLYSGIRAANSVSYYAQTAQVDDKTKSQLIGEARVLAAYEYYLLVNNFGGVPIMKDFLTTADTGYPKSSAADVYTYIISELEEVISKNVLQASTATKGGGRISQETAKAILAKTYLSAAWDLNKQDYFSKAAALADEVIAGRKLTTPFAKLWKADGSGDDNEEFLWDVEYDLATANNTTSGGTEWSGYYCNYLGGNEDNIKATTSSYVPTLYALHCFKKGDQRYDATFMKELPDINKGNAAGTGYWTWYKNGESLVGKPVTRYYSAWYETDADFEAWKAIDPANRANTYRIPMDSQSKEAQNMDEIVKPAFLTLFNVVLSIVNDVVARIVVGRGCKKVLRRKLLHHRVNEVSSFDRRAVIPFKIVTKRHCKSLTFFSVGSKTIFACIFFRYVFEFGRRRVFNGVCAGNDLAVCIEFVVELIECTREIRFHRVVDVVT